MAAAAATATTAFLAIIVLVVMHSYCHHYCCHCDAAKSAQNISSFSTAAVEPKADVEKGQEEVNSGLPAWMLELVPTVKYYINNGQVAFGNQLLETTLCFKFESATGIYTTSQMNQVFAPEVKAENDEEIPDSDPHWGIDVVFLKNTTLCYGPWVDRQRNALQKFFYPFDYQEVQATKPLVPGQRRVHTGLDIKLTLTQLAFCGEVFDLTFVLQYFRFIPEIEEIKSFCRLRSWSLECFVPKSNTLRTQFSVGSPRTTEKKREQALRSRSSTTTGNIDEAVESADEQPITSTAEETISGGWRRHTDESLG
ncbi:hypothetical protein OS493_025986 [Desmophyllum pertusum]|uniref:Uncharacterized protein n=1 Tax=Desmophyllum pertusum TaxID=174260 RepID=A0A9W9YMH3_9CNID|nr:hypothetical protein OS493_025986 [Desmophyllum pertusum]